jgi:hypothetical protein
VVGTKVRFLLAIAKGATVVEGRVPVEPGRTSSTSGISISEKGAVPSTDMVGIDLDFEVETVDESACVVQHGSSL